MEILLISEKYLKSHSYLNDNVGAEFITPAIGTAQELGLQPLIGTALYNKIIGAVADGSIQTEGDYKLLLDNYITPYLTFKVLADIQLPLSFKFRNQGMIQDAGDKVYSTGLKDVQALVEYYDNKAKFYAQRLSNYLCANTNLYPEYHTHVRGEMSANRNAYKTGIVL